MNLTKADLLRTWQSKSLSIVLFAYVGISVIAAAQGLLAGPKIYVPGGRAYIDYNNFRIFKFSFYHLVQGKDIYQLFPDDHWDLYKYSPGFALCFRVAVLDAGYDRVIAMEPDQFAVPFCRHPACCRDR
jgi:hypothetical protein